MFMNCERCPLRAEVDVLQAARTVVQDESLRLSASWNSEYQVQLDEYLLAAQTPEKVELIVALAEIAGLSVHVEEVLNTWGNSQDALFKKAEEALCDGPKVRRRFRFFGRVASLECGSDRRIRRLGDV